MKLLVYNLRPRTYPSWLHPRNSYIWDPISLSYSQSQPLWLSDSKQTNGEVTFKQTTTTLLKSFGVAQECYNSTHNP